MNTDRKIDSRSYQKAPPESMVVKTPAALSAAILRIFLANQDRRVWLFRGQLGAGKTTAIRGILRHSGVRGVISSPTFALLRTYSLSSGLVAYHVDAYRICGRDEWAGVGLLDALDDPRAVVLVEWPEKLTKLPWGRRVEIKIALTPDGRRVSWKLVG